MNTEPSSFDKAAESLSFLELQLQEERELRSKILELDKLKAEYFENVFQEFRGPLMSIVGPVYALLSDRFGPLDARVREQLEMVARGSARLRQRIDQLLDLAKFDAGAMELSYQAVDLSAFATWVSSAFKAEAERLHISLLVEAPSQSVVVARMDPRHIGTALSNLLSNALEFTAAGGKVRLGVTINDCTVQLSVKDTGSGIARDRIDTLFERFRRDEGAANRMFEHTGVGLALAKALVELHGGAIAATSEVGFGSEFVISLPIGAALSSERLQDALPSGTSTHEPHATSASMPSDTTVAQPEFAVKPTRCQRILVVDDDRTVLRLAKEFLVSRGFQVMYAENGAAGWEMMLSELPDVVVSDVRMPVMDGLELLALARENPRTRHIPFLFMTSSGTTTTLIGALRGGADDYLIKPIQGEELIEGIDRIIQKSAADNELRPQNLQRRFQDFASTLPALSDDLKSLVRILNEDAAIALNKIRYVTEKILHTRAVAANVNWGAAEPTLERMIGPLVAANELPRNIALHVRTIQTNASPGSHFQASALSTSHVLIAAEALTNLLEWHSQNGCQQARSRSKKKGAQRRSAQAVPTNRSDDENAERRPTKGQA